jgi:hypothetical protein
MEFLSPNECAEWATSQGFFGDVPIPRDVSLLSQAIKLESSNIWVLENKGTVLTDSILGQEGLLWGKNTAGDSKSQYLLWLTDWGLYRPFQMRLFESCRESLGEHLPLIEKPGHLALDEDTLLLQGLLFLAIQYLWDGVLLVTNIPGTEKAALAFDNDCGFRAFSSSPDFLSDFDGLMKGLGGRI